LSANAIWCLSVHANYRCRDSGACCSSGWPIPVEIPLYERMTTALADGSLQTIAAPTPFAFANALPEGSAALLGCTDDGRCAFYEADARRCHIHRLKGHDWLPIACQQFPRMCLMDTRGTRVTFSHYCPTAADLLFDDQNTPLALVKNPPSVRADVDYEGLDARDAFPPLLRPGVLMDWDTLDAFETHALRLLDAESDSVDTALAHLIAITERLRAWRSTDGPLIATLDRALEQHPPAKPIDTTFVLQLDAAARDTVPTDVAPDGPEVVMAKSLSPNIQTVCHHDLTLPARDIADAYARWVDPAWRAFTRPLCRYVAAKLVANWCWYQGAGLRTVMRSLEAAVAVVRVEAARQTMAHGRMLDRELLRAAFRRADLLLLHLCSQEALARRWSDAEVETPDTHEAS
jgi:Fe-S-cluster containining protein